MEGNNGSNETKRSNAQIIEKLRNLNLKYIKDTLPCTKNKVFHSADLVTFTEEIVNEKLHFLCTVHTKITSQSYIK